MTLHLKQKIQTIVRQVKKNTDQKSTKSKQHTVTSQQLRGLQRFKKLRSVQNLPQQELIALKEKTNPGKQRQNY